MSKQHRPQRAAQDAMRRFADAISHKLSNPLTYMQNYLFILKSSAGDPRQAEMIEKIESGISRTKDILFRIVDATGPVKGSAEKITPETLAGFVMARAAGRADVALRADSAFGEPELNRLAFQSILEELTDNAVQSGATLLVVEAGRDAEGPYVCVADNGSGIPPEHWDSIFEPLQSSRKDALGLGLYTAAHIAASMGGSLSFTCPPDGGTRFLLRIP